MTVDPLIKENTTEEEQELLILMWGAIARRDRIQGELDQINIGSRLYSECDKRLEDAREDLKKQRKITLGKLYHSNNKVWRYLTSPLRDKSILEGD